MFVWAAEINLLVCPSRQHSGVKNWFIDCRACFRNALRKVWFCCFCCFLFSKCGLHALLNEAECRSGTRSGRYRARWILFFEKIKFKCVTNRYIRFPENLQGRSLTRPLIFKRLFTEFSVTFSTKLCYGFQTVEFWLAQFNPSKLSDR